MKVLNLSLPKLIKTIKHYLIMKKHILLIAFVCGALSMHAQNSALKSSIEKGVQTSQRQTANHEWKEAFATCRNLDASIMAQAKGKEASALRYLVTKERLRMYVQLNKGQQCKEQLVLLEQYANGAQSEAVKEDFLFTSAKFYQSHGQTDKSTKCYRDIVNIRMAGKGSDKVEATYKELLSQANKNGDKGLARIVEGLYTAWQDSTAAARAAQELKKLKVDYDASQNTISDMDSTIGTQKGLIVFLSILSAALGGGLVVFIGIMLKNLLTISKLKKSLEIANENNELKSKFIGCLGEQINPSLDGIEGGNVKPNVVALRGLIDQARQYMELESTRENKYELKEIPLNTVCEGVMEEAKGKFKREIPVVISVSKMTFPASKEPLQEVLDYVVSYVAKQSATEKITMELKKRNSHTCHILISASGFILSDEEKEKVFKPFTRIVDLLQEDCLGLPICSLKAYKMNGLLRFNDEFKKGTQFVLEIHS